MDRPIGGVKTVIKLVKLSNMSLKPYSSTELILAREQKTNSSYGQIF
jgi:hypothetical protein